MAERKETWRETARFWSYRALERIAMATPEAIGDHLATTLGGLACRCLGSMRDTVAANQARVLGLDRADERVRRSTREAFALYARYWYDTFRLRSMTPAEIDARTEIFGRDHVEAALARGNGCLGILLHMGNWDVAGRFFALKGYRVASVAEDLRPARLSELFLEHRRALGMEIISLADEAVASKLVDLLAENWIVALLADRDLTGHGVEVEMFGARRRVPAGPAVLAITTGAPLLVCPVFTTPNGWRIEIGAPLAVEPTGDQEADVRTLSQRMAASFERAIAACPADWHVFQPAWPEPRPDPVEA